MFGSLRLSKFVIKFSFSCFLAQESTITSLTVVLFHMNPSNDGLDDFHKSYGIFCIFKSSIIPAGIYPLQKL